MKLKLIVVTVTYLSAPNELRLFIDSFDKYNDLNEQAKLIIVDNSPYTYHDIENLIKRYNHIDYIPNPSNPGFGASNNIGFKQYNSDYVLFINNDVEFIEPVFKKIISVHENDSKLGCIGIHQCGGSPSFFKKFNAPPHTTIKKFIDQYHFISGAFMFFKSDVFKKCGCFDEKIFMYLEEFDISTRLIQNGYHTMYCAQYSFLHKVGNRRIVNRKAWISVTNSFCYICTKYGINQKKYFSSQRLYKLLIYHLLRLNFKQVKEAVVTIRNRKQILKSYTQKLSINKSHSKD